MFFFLNGCCVLVFNVSLCCSVCWFLCRPFCHGALKPDISTLFTTFFFFEHLFNLYYMANELVDVINPARPPNFYIFKPLSPTLHRPILKMLSPMSIVYKCHLLLLNENIYILNLIEIQRHSLS